MSSMTGFFCCKRCKKAFNGGNAHLVFIEWCEVCWNLWAKGPVTQQLSQEFIRDAEWPSAAERFKAAKCVCGAH